MKRTETHPRPTAGCLSVPLFNQRKRSRLPLTSNPSENEFSSAIEFNDSDFADSSSSVQNQSQRPLVPFAPRGQWNRPVNQQPQQVSNQPARYPGPAVRTYAPIPHPHKPTNIWSQHNAPGRQGTVMSSNQGQSGSSYGQGNVHCRQGNMQFKPKPPNHQQNGVPARQTETVMSTNQGPSASGSSFGQRSVHHSQGHMQFKPHPHQQHMFSGRQETFVPTNQGQSGAAYGRGNARHGQLNMQSKPQPLSHQQLTMQQSLGRQTHSSGGARLGGVPFSGPRFPTAPEPQNKTPQWKMQLSSQHRQSKNVNTDFCATEPSQSQQQKSPAVQVKPMNEMSLRILTVVIEGMRHWSQFKNKAPMLFELFATLDSAVTDGKYGAKSFIMRTGKDVVSCVYFENDQELPKLFRGLVHRCMGNYDRQSDTFTCVSVRLASRYEQKNSLEAIRASDDEMRLLVQSLSEI